MTDTLPQVSARQFNRVQSRARVEAETELAALERIYARILEVTAKGAAKAFRAQNKVMIAAAWIPPPEGSLLSADAVAALAAPQLRAAHRRILEQAMGQPLTQVGIRFDITNPFSVGLIDSAGARTGAAIEAAVRPVLQATIQDAFVRGLSVLDTAALIQENIIGASAAQSRALARTDLNSIANGGSVASARMVGVAYKQWLSAHDDKVRPDHVDADGQIVPTDQPFQVGGETAMYPGDPALSDEEAINCRCTVVYLDDLPTAEVASAQATQALEVRLATEPDVKTLEALALLGSGNAAAMEAMQAATVEVQQLLARMTEILDEVSRPRVREVTVTRDERELIVRMRITDV